MPRSTISLFRRMERALQTIAQGSTTLDTIREVAQLLVDSFAADLGLSGGRIYSQTNGQYELVATFGDVSKAPVGLKIPRRYAPIEQLRESGCLIMDRSDAVLDQQLEADLGTRQRFAAVAVADGAFLLSFDVVSRAEVGEGLLSTLNIVRLAISQKLREDRMRELLEEARLIQHSILPRQLPTYGDFQLAARTEPAEIVGGDFYDIITLTDTTFDVVVADATGHGLPAALQVRDVFTGLRMGLSREYKLTETLARLNRIIHRSRLATKFVSLFLAEIEVGGTVLYSNAGHPPAILVRTDGAVEKLTTGGMILGPRPDATYAIDLVRLRPGDVLTLYSDGITEARDTESDEEYSTDRLIRLLQSLHRETADAIVEGIFKSVADFSRTTPPEDDQTVVVVKRTPPAEET